MPKRNAEETALSKSIRAWLRWQRIGGKKIMAVRINRGKAFYSGRTGKRVVDFGGFDGQGDIIAHLPPLPGQEWGPTLYIECKAGKRKQSDNQIEFQRRVIECGHLAIVAREIGDVEAAILEYERGA